jgi:hypothetical protein
VKTECVEREFLATNIQFTIHHHTKDAYWVRIVTYKIQIINLGIMKDEESVTEREQSSFM